MVIEAATDTKGKHCLIVQDKTLYMSKYGLFVV